MPIQTVDPATLKDWLDRGEAILIDVREPEEHQKENIPGAISLPLEKFHSEHCQSWKANV
ncbi:rhodanese-like domain-containing protein [Legionella tunisiensis]|uniref:rhodanese-like domain-containing protein n=1 Tax=Legionella tunisiensis TaxID=1034944 RepID=UPI00030C4B62|nr:rhodanese-like domain-containing protein [Legionella tunisiensis]